jgi:hypothetical protein
LGEINTPTSSKRATDATLSRNIIVCYLLKGCADRRFGKKIAYDNNRLLVCVMIILLAPSLFYALCTSWVDFPEIHCHPPAIDIIVIIVIIKNYGQTTVVNGSIIFCRGGVRT